LQASILVPHYRSADQSARGLPVRFTEVPAVKKPGKRATDEDRETYRQAIKEHNLSTAFLKDLKELREAFDKAGAQNKVIIAALDGSFCTRTCLSNNTDRTILVARVRKDAKFCFPAPKGSRSVYDPHKFTPQQLRHDQGAPWCSARIFHGGAWREVRYKEVNNVLWQGGTQRKSLRLFVIAATPYRVRPNGPLYYREPGYVVSTDCQAPAVILLQTYFDRWQIEVNHRDEKDTLGIGQAQVWSKKSVPRQPAFMAAAYSALLLASIETFGASRTNDYMPLPKWRRGATRPSILDLVTVLRKELATDPACAKRFNLHTTLAGLVMKAAA
ncbi:MAG: hypothetical protein ACRD3S_19990, partial [Terracidiphilus sp.]